MKRAVALAGLLAAVSVAPVAAMEKLSQGKTVQQVYKSDCAICHDDAGKVGASKSPQQLSAFLAQHYTTSKSEAAALAGYLASIGQTERERDRRPQRARAKPRAKDSQ